MLRVGVVADTPWADAYARITYRFEHLMLRYCQIVTPVVWVGPGKRRESIDVFFNNLNAFTDMIFLTVGDVDIPAQIPATSHTLK